jgi:hypothetical protein
MSPELISILALAAMFVVATIRPVNMGVLAFVGAFLVGTLVADLSTDIIAGYPADLFLTLVGITYLFAIAQNNGTIDWIVRAALRLVGGRATAIPWIMFATAAVLTAIGAVSPGAVAIVAPIARGFAAQYGINPLLVGLMVVHGAQAAASPRSASTAASPTAWWRRPGCRATSWRRSSPAWSSTPSSPPRSSPCSVRAARAAGRGGSHPSSRRRRKSGRSAGRRRSKTPTPSR